MGVERGLLQACHCEWSQAALSSQWSHQGSWEEAAKVTAGPQGQSGGESLSPCRPLPLTSGAGPGSPGVSQVLSEETPKATGDDLPGARGGGLWEGGSEEQTSPAGPRARAPQPHSPCLPPSNIRRMTGGLGWSLKSIPCLSGPQRTHSRGHRRREWLRGKGGWAGPRVRCRAVPGVACGWGSGGLCVWVQGLGSLLMHQR